MTFKTRNEIHPDYAYIGCEGDFDQERIPKIITIVDAKNNSLLWHGVAQGYL
jgi:hypothetical protein